MIIEVKFQIPEEKTQEAVDFFRKNLNNKYQVKNKYGWTCDFPIILSKHNFESYVLTLMNRKSSIVTFSKIQTDGKEKFFYYLEEWNCDDDKKDYIICFCYLID